MKKIKFENRNDDDANNNYNHEPAVLCHNFWTEAPEDLLMEIFIRHPDCRSVARTSTVCRRWHSVILRNPHFIQRFKSHHHHKILSWTIMFRKSDFYTQFIPKPQHFGIVCQLYSDEWMFLYGKSPAYCLDFLPAPMLIIALCNDLLLVSPGISYTDDLYICNPVTKQFVQLPPIPRLEDPIIYKAGKIGYALVPMPPSAAATNSQFKVVEVLHPCDYKNFRRLHVSVYSSESRKWEIIHFLGPPPKLFKTFMPPPYYSNIIRCNEILFWLGTCWESERIGYYDMSKEKCGAIDIPFSDTFLTYEIGILHVSGGVHELRLTQLLSVDTKSVHLRVWRLNNNHNNNDHEINYSNWFLVHDKKLERPKNVSNLPRLLPGTVVHPTNGDLVFLVWEKTVVKYNLINETYKKSAELLENVDWFHLTPFLIVH